MSVSTEFQAQLDRIEGIVTAIKAESDPAPAVAAAQAEDAAALKVSLDAVDPSFVPPAPEPAPEPAPAE